jgi:NAD-dependent dihydropyrimidine dehydrogenase PreA subunit
MSDKYDCLVCRRDVVLTTTEGWGETQENISMSGQRRYYAMKLDGKLAVGYDLKTCHLCSICQTLSPEEVISSGGGDSSSNSSSSSSSGSSSNISGGSKW